MNVRVTVLASLSDVAEYHLDVTLDAGYRLVHAAQRIARLIVIEFRDRTDGPPSGRGVAVLTGNIQTSVRTVRTTGCLRLRASRDSGNAEEQHRHQTKQPPRPKHNSPPAWPSTTLEETTMKASDER